jgi:hypothetical protein
MNGTNYYLTRDGQSYGPYSAQEMLEMLKSGQMTAEELICPVGGDQWVQAYQIFAVPTSAPVHPRTAQQCATPQISAEMVNELHQKYRKGVLNSLYSAMLAFFPVLIHFTSGQSEEKMLRSVHGRHSGLEALCIVLAKWWPLALVVGLAGVIFFMRKALKHRAESQRLEMLHLQQQAQKRPSMWETPARR